MHIDTEFWIVLGLGIVFGAIIFNGTIRSRTFNRIKRVFYNEPEPIANINHREYKNSNPYEVYSNIVQNVKPNYVTSGLVIVDRDTGSRYHIDWNCPNAVPRFRYNVYTINQIENMYTHDGKKFNACEYCCRGN